MATRKNEAPTKQFVNLAQEEHAATNRMSTIIAFVCLAVFVAAFCKFGVIDRLNAAWSAERAADSAQTTLNQLEEQTANYDDVLEEYRSYTALAEGADPMKCLDLIESKLMRSAKVQQFTVADGLISVQISGVTLQQVSSIYADLMKSDLVDSVQIYTAATEEDSADQVNANLTIQLVSTDSGEEADS
jgi:hypothetical protein